MNFEIVVAETKITAPGIVFDDFTNFNAAVIYSTRRTVRAFFRFTYKFHPFVKFGVIILNEFFERKIKFIGACRTEKTCAGFDSQRGNFFGDLFAGDYKSI
ncbi:MAG: hypothetical protein SR3Q1_02250 [Quinella sp. 3Q1]|nr:hypothetical protein [Quinella sp. 3Q1]MBR3051274.1 hypothetical protein [Selenomonadaceae bacterium]MBR6888644.1 hypothetical protein [Selenomonadaceae bacterium]